MENIRNYSIFKKFLVLRKCIKQVSSNASNMHRHYHLCSAYSTSPNNIIRQIQLTTTQRRTFFQLPKMPSPKYLFKKEKKFTERKIVGYSPEQMYKVVAQVNHYQEFVPWCKKSVITLNTPNLIKADMVIGFPPVTESYTSHVTLIQPKLIKAECRDGKLFNYMITTWKFSPGLPENGKTCTLDFDITFEFRSALHSKLATVFFEEVVRKMANAFLQRAETCYGKESIKCLQVFQSTYS